MVDNLNFKDNNPGAVQFGNFINYYQFHPAKNRVSLLPADIWRNSLNNSCTVLDVGCNAGDLTIALYDFLHETVGIPECNILGIDIDPILVDRASEKKSMNCTFECVNIMNKNIQQNNVYLKYLEKHNCTKFDIVFCFSITMWIHLNYGDEGLKSFLKKVSKITNFLVVEPQPWKCYRSAVKRLKSSNCVFPQFKELKIRENIEFEIEKYLIQNCGMIKVEESVKTEWNRKLLCFKTKD